jgi:hypothetical protein
VQLATAMTTMRRRSRALNEQEKEMQSSPRLPALVAGGVAMSLLATVGHAASLTGAVGVSEAAPISIVEKVHEGHGGKTPPYGTPPCHRHKAQPGFAGYPDCHVHVFENGKWEIRRRYKVGNKWVNCPVQCNWK